MATRPLEGSRVIITRPEEQAGEMAHATRELGGVAVLLPMIRILPAEDTTRCDLALRELKPADAVAFTSANAVRFTMNRAEAIGLAHTSWEGREVFAVGNKTAETARRYGLPVTVVPGEFSGAGLATSLSDRSWKGKRVLLPRSDIGREDLLNSLRAAGADVVPVVVYRTVGPDDTSARLMRQEVLKGGPAVLTFASPSAVRNFGKLFTAEELAAHGPGLTIAAIGATTQEAIEALPLPVRIVAKEATSGGLIASVASYIQSQSIS
ncbi:MAG: uroporphyrinogen-III synthase [Bacteroidetes bacterium]|nr:uroporphyrinogen-III synthase [Bacteroidota bacterium]